MAINPLDSTLHIVDDTMVLRLTPDLRIQVVAGKSPLCPSGGGGDIPEGPITDLGFSPHGEMVFATKDHLYKTDANGGKPVLIDMDSTAGLAINSIFFCFLFVKTH